MTKIVKYTDQVVYAKPYAKHGAFLNLTKPDAADIFNGWKQVKDIYKVSYNQRDTYSSGDNLKTYYDLIKLIREKLNLDNELFILPFLKKGTHIVSMTYENKCLPMPNIKDKVIYVAVDTIDYTGTEEDVKELKRILRVKTVHDMYNNFIEPNIKHLICDEMEFVKQQCSIEYVSDIIYGQHLDICNENCFLYKVIVEGIENKIKPVFTALGLTYSIYANLSNIFIKINYDSLDKALSHTQTLINNN